MTRKNRSARKRSHKVTVSRMVTVARAAKKWVKAALIANRNLPPPVETEPRLFENPALHALRKERLRLLDEIKHQKFIAQENSGTGNHIADIASEVTEQVTTLALRSHLEKLLKEVERAIVRAERGTYGLCERCNKPISKERLQVIRSATLCIECAQSQIRPLKAAA